MKKVVFLLLVISLNSFSEDILVKFKKESLVLPLSNLRVADHVFKLPANQIHLFQSNNVEWAQRNHQLGLRSNPNDPQFPSQWSLEEQANDADVNVTELWNLGVGGNDRLGNEIVIAVIDGGVDITHNDLKDNIWVNNNEVADNQVDDDGNGYIDDVHGWNAGTNSGEITPSNHGTHVAGIIGAVGHNNLQITGLNWKVKILPIVLESFSTDEVLRAYQYVIDLKRQWIESNGLKGANIVATNSSFGIDYADCENGEYPAWNDFFNQMGELGILSAAATANNDVNVDEKGDVPTGCSSPYIVAVTNTTKGNVKYRSAGYGKIAIDLGAPGTDIPSTIIGNKVDEFTGTSMATPHVAGAIGLLFSLAPESFIEKYKNLPGPTVLELKDNLLKGTEANTSLQGITVSGGKLNLIKSYQQF